MFGITLNANIKLAKIWTAHYPDYFATDWYIAPTSTDKDLIYGDDHMNVVDAGDGNDMIWGGAGNDVVYAGFGNDFIDGGTGDDWLEGDSGNDRILGGSGNDTIYGDSSGRWYIYGPAGNDTLYGGAGSDTIFGQEGNDYLDGGTDSDLLDGGEGNDRLIGGSGDDRMYGGNGADIFQFGFAIDNRSKLLDMGALWGHDIVSDFSVVQGDRLDLTTFFARFADADVDAMMRSIYDTYYKFVRGTGNVDSDHPNVEDVSSQFQLDSLGGEQSFKVWIDWGTFNEAHMILNIQNVSYGNAAQIFLPVLFMDYTFGNFLYDQQLFTSLGTYKAIHMTSGNDKIDFSDTKTWTDFTHSDANKAAQIFAFEGNDTVKGTANNDSIYGGTGDDILYGYKGNDALYGENGSDQLFGDDGNDTLSGGNGNDMLYGGAGRDTLNGDVGDDVLTGGADADRFVFGGTIKGDLVHTGVAPTMDFSANGSDIIMDFSRADGDKILLTNVNSQIGMNQSFVSDWFNDFASTTSDVNDDGIADTIIFNDRAHTQVFLTVYDVALTSSDFLFS